MEQVWVVLAILSFIYAGGMHFLYRHFTNIYEAQMDITEKLLRMVVDRKDSESEEE